MYRKKTRGDSRKVLLVGAGALGCAAARTLAAAGLGDHLALTLADPDRVELSNLQRQVLYDDGDLEAPKVEAAVRRLSADFGIAATPAQVRVDAANGPALVAAHDIVVDGTDDPETKFLLNRLCVDAGLPLVHAGVARTGGQWMLVEPGQSACLECVFPRAPGGDAQGCATLGILAPVAGFVGSMQAWVALARLLRPEHVRAGRLFVYELGGVRLRHVDFPRNPQCSCSHREDRGENRVEESAAAARPFPRRHVS